MGRWSDLCPDFREPALQKNFFKERGPSTKIEIFLQVGFFNPAAGGFKLTASKNRFVFAS